MPCDNGPESSTALYLERVRQVAIPAANCQTTAVFGRVHQNPALGAKCDVRQRDGQTDGPMDALHIT